MQSLRRYGAALWKHRWEFAKTWQGKFGAAGFGITPLGVAGLSGNVWWVVLALAFFLGLVYGTASYAAWRDSDEFARSYAQDTEIQRVLAASLREARELRNRIVGASDTGLSHLHGDLPGWVWHVGMELDRLPARELQDEIYEHLPGSATHDETAFWQAVGEPDRDTMIGYLDAGIAQLAGFQDRLAA